MSNGAKNVLISLEGKYANQVMAGTKVIELRRRSMAISAGTTVWLYAKAPTSAVLGCARVSEVYLLAPTTLWRRFSKLTGLTRGEFFDYFEGASQGFAMRLAGFEPLPSALPLDTIRRRSEGFHPPQFFARLDAKDVLKQFEDARDAMPTSRSG